VQETFVAPTGNDAPEAGEQVVVNGACPPLAVGGV
jgi:hypothetical protein